jgi:hypothetical protein
LRRGSDSGRKQASVRIRLVGAILALVLLISGCGSSEHAGLGLPGAGQTGFTFMGRIDQNGPSFSFYGYLTSLDGLDDAQLFAAGTSPAERNEASALFTFHGTSELTSRSILVSLFSVEAEGGMSIFYAANPVGATFGEPTSFAQGTLIASMNLDIRNLITVIAPNTGLSTAQGTLTQTDHEEFEVGDDDKSFGADDAVWRLTATGLGNRLEPETPIAVINVAGEAVTIEQ